MKVFGIFWILFASLTACSSTPGREYPTCEIPGPGQEVAHALEVPEMPSEVSETKTSATYDIEGLLQLSRVYKTGITNAKVAEKNAEALELRNDEVRELIECTRFQNVWIEFQGEDLQDKTKELWMDGIFHWVVVGVVAVKSVL